MPSLAFLFLAYYPCSLINKTSLVLLFCSCSLVICLFRASGLESWAATLFACRSVMFAQSGACAPKRS
ncbi:hypothetical protein L1987_17517 [Smallanthus sonchifolius]|uniref:Uncharacterized protein n=1 Tax=Smallanthus sonchifolius TaxID=185202 RepID=A0ACB9IXQ8_9ASTR|nr:hypothetical protein L1987_17517 [Smallanthus sonchifolius]